MTSTEPLEEFYFKWLYEKYIGFNEEEPETHWHLCSHLQHTRYRWSVPNDDNRAEDGKFLRETFWHDTMANGEHIPVDFFKQDCSVLEFLIALSERAEFESMKPQMWWFWEFIGNLRLLTYNDNYLNLIRRNSAAIKGIDRRIGILLDRTYDFDGTGGLFPLEAPPVDQRTAEVWYQMSTYILEHQ